MSFHCVPLCCSRPLRGAAACPCAEPPTKRTELEALWPHSARGAKETGFMVLVMVIGLACVPRP